VPLSRLTYVAYRTRNFTGAQAEFNAHKVIQAVKGRDVRGYAWVPNGDGTRFKLQESNRTAVFPWFGKLAATEIARRFPDLEICLVPIPHSDCIRGVEVSKAATIARHIARRNNDLMSVWDGLRWVEANPASSQGGSRDAKELLGNLMCVEELPHGRLCIIVDDVSTSGAHFQAAEARMSREAAVVALALAVGQTVHDPVEDPFGWVETELPLHEQK
jgi:hypothetical protein